MVAEAVAAGPHDQCVALMADRGEEVAAGADRGRHQEGFGIVDYWTTVVSTFSTHSGKKTGSRFDQPGAVAAASLIDWSRVRRRSGWRWGKAEAAQKAPGSHGRTLAPTSRS